MTGNPKPFAALMRKTVPFALVAMLAVTACGGRSEPSTPSAAQQQTATMSVTELHERLQTPGAKPLVVDVREQNEYDAGHIDGVRLAPLGNVEAELADVPKDTEILLICRSGNRSGKAADRLAARGYTNLTNVEGGMLAWEANGYPAVKP